jgi:hypothetical protein
MKRGMAVVVFAILLVGCSGTGATTESFKDVGGALATPVATETAGETRAAFQDTNSVASAMEDTTRKVIETASIQMEVADPAATAGTIRALAIQFGGYVSDEQTYRQTTDGPTYSSLQIRVPTDRLADFLDAVQGDALEVLSLTTSSVDISEQYSDLEAQLENLTAYEDELRLLLSDVRDRPGATPDDLLAVYESIRQVRGEIEQLQGRQQLWDSQVALATVSVTLTPSETVEPIVEEGWNAGSIFRAALRGLVSGLQWLASVVIWFVIFVLPILVLILIPVGFVIWFVRRRRRQAAQHD